MVFFYFHLLFLSILPRRNFNSNVNSIINLFPVLSANTSKITGNNSNWCVAQRSEQPKNGAKKWKRARTHTSSPMRSGKIIIRKKGDQNHGREYILSMRELNNGKSHNAFTYIHIYSRRRTFKSIFSLLFTKRF